jgi:hypothetical protein
VGTVPLLLDSRRQYRIAAAVVGHDLAADGARSVEEFVLDSARASGPAERRELVISLLHSHLIAGPAVLVEAAARQVPDDLAVVVGLAAALGIGPRRLREVDVSAAATVADALQACEVALAQLSDSEPPAVVMNEATLRSLSSTAEAATRWSVDPLRSRRALATPAGVYASVWRHYGIALPGLAVEVDDGLPDGRYRFRFGETVTSSYLLLPDGVVAEAEPDDVDSVVGRTLEPLGGEWYALVPAGAASADGTRTAFDTVALLMRTLFAELHARLPLWADRANALQGADAVVEPLADDVRGALRPIVRWLLADGVAIGHPWPLLEAVARVLARGEDSSTAMLEEARCTLGGAVFGHAPSAGRVAVLRLDPSAVSAAVAQGSAGPLVDAHAELTRSTLTGVAVCPAAQRAAVAALLRPLLGVVRVMTDAELAGAVVNLPDVATPSEPVRAGTA